MPTTEKTKPALTINQLTDQERGICQEALHHGVKEMHRMIDDLKVLPANLSQSEALLLLTVLSELPPETQALVDGLMCQLRAAGQPVAKSGTVIHFPPP
jgi:hypothetical protein